MKRLRLIEARKQSNKSCQQVAESIGVTKSLISQFENCRCKPSISVAFKLEHFFGIPASELLAESEEGPEITDKLLL